MINLNAIPVKEPFYIRKENNVYRIIPSIGYGFMKIINKTSKQILDSIDGNKSLNEILYCLYTKYRSTEKKTIKDDFLNTILELYGAKIISFNKMEKGENLNMEHNIIYKNDELEIEIIHFAESDLNLIMSFLNGKKHLVILNDAIENVFNEITIRNALFAYSSEFYGIIKKGEVQAIISYDERMTKYGNYYRNGMFAYENTLSNMEMEFLLQQSSKDLCEKEIYNCKKIRFSFLEKDSCILPKILENIGYLSVLKENRYLVGNFSEFIYDFEVEC